jgi:hypothetical protein
MEETGGPGENHRPLSSHRQTLSHNAVLASWFRMIKQMYNLKDIFVYFDAGKYITLRFLKLDVCVP